MKNYFCTAIGAAGTLIAGWFGGCDAVLASLLVFMAIDYVTGLMVAAVFHKSKKTASGRAESKASFKGLCKKCTTLLFVLVGARLDILIGATYIRDGICIGFIANELISIVENAGLMGIRLPNVIANAIDVLTAKSEESANKIKEEKKNE